MLGHTYPGEACSAARALELVGERWTLLILRDALFRGHVRYSQFAESLGVATNILAKRLNTLVSSGLMEARGTSLRAAHRAYHLTQRGEDLKAVIVALTEWGDRWLGDGPAEFRSGPAGEIVRLEFRGAESGDAVAASRVCARRRGAA